MNNNRFWMTWLLAASAMIMVCVAETTTDGEAKGEAPATPKEAPATPKQESVITADKIEFDNKEGVILFDKNVLVNDEQFIMRSDRLIVFMEGTNDVDQIMAIGNVSLTNENRSARCEKAVYTRKDGQIVMTGNDAQLEQLGDKAGAVSGKRIAIWLNDERVEVSPGRVVLPPGTFKGVDKKLIP
ncbi:MAG: LptA/OstA family protein [Kiritimatiellae bacterium]|nr:LptA/OstA family protein [Kiritimatiellia bacterium]